MIKQTASKAEIKRAKKKALRIKGTASVKTMHNLADLGKIAHLYNR